MEQPRGRQRRALGTMLPVLQNIAQMEDIGLLPYQPNPLATLLSGVARALLPLAMVRQARALEQERQRQQRLAELAPIIAQYPAGQVPEQLWREYTQLAGVEAPPPPEPPEAALRRRLMELEVTRAERFLPYEEEQMRLGIEQIRQGLTAGQISIEEAQERLRQMREEWDFVRQFRGLELERLRAENRPLREVAPELVQRLPERLKGLADLPAWQVAMLNQSGILGLMADEFVLPASQFLTDSQKRWLQERGINPDQISFGTLVKVMPDVFRATKTVKETFSDHWQQVVRQFPFIEAMGDLPATPEIIFSLHDLYIKDEQSRRQTARQIYDDILRRISEAQQKGAPASLVGAWIAQHNILARELGLPEISPQEAQQIIATAATIYDINVKKQGLSLVKTQVDIQKGIVSMRTMEANAAANQARTNAYIANVASQIQHRQVQEAQKAQEQAWKQMTGMQQMVEQRLQRIMQTGQPMTIQWQGQTYHATFVKGLGWQLRRPDGTVIPANQVNQTVLSQLIRQRIRDEVMSELFPSPSQQLQRPQRPTPQTPETPAQRLRGRQPQQRPAVVGVRRE
jgi:hypothetical protein